MKRKLEWRVGRKLGRTIYCDDVCIGLVDTSELANDIVLAMNANEPIADPVLRLNGPALRPHTIPGWWQVWSGHLCIALLSQEDVRPILDAAVKALAGEVETK